MPICFICKEEFLDIKVLRIYFEYNHKEVKLYKCVENNCQNRKFDTFESLKRHFNLHHNIQKLQMFINEDKNFNNEQNVNVGNFDLENDNFVESSNLDSSEFNCLLHYNNFDIQNRTIIKVTSFFAKLLSNYGLPRNHVQNLYQEIQELFFKDCLNKIEDCLDSI